MAAKKKERIKVGSVSIPFYQWTDPKSQKSYWRWSWKDAAGKWCYGTRADKQEAIDAARARARTISNGKLDLESITEVQADLVRQFLALDPTSEDVRKLREWRATTSITLRALVDQRQASKLSELHGEESPHLTRVRQWMEKLAGAIPGPACEIRMEQLRDYIEGHSDSPKSRKENRARVVALWDFARVHEIFDSQEANKLPVYKLGKDKTVEIFTPKEIKTLLAGVPAEFLPWLCFAAFSGLRSEEISAAPGTKSLLGWEQLKKDADGKYSHIDLPAALSKVHKRRLVPITDTMAAWLDHIKPPAKGPICAGYPAKNVTETLGKLVGGWKKNALRHSYGSYRAAVTKDLGALAIEMGTSYGMIEKHYREAVTEAKAELFWQLTPSEVFRK